MKRFTALMGLILVAFFVASCAVSEKVQVVKIGDNKLSCKELVEEMEKLDKAQAEVDAKKGVTGVNVAAALFWLPGLAYTFYDAAQATKLIEQRRAHIINLYNEKDCDSTKSAKRKKKRYKKKYKKYKKVKSKAKTGKDTKQPPPPVAPFGGAPFGAP